MHFMVLSRTAARVTVVFVLLILIMSTYVSRPAFATRSLHDDDEMHKSLLIANAFQRGPVPPSGPSPCTFIPGQGSGHCPLS